MEYFDFPSKVYTIGELVRLLLFYLISLEQEFRAQEKVPVAAGCCPYRERTVCSHREPERGAEPTKRTTKDQLLIFLCSNFCCLELCKLRILLMRKVTFFFFTCVIYRTK